MRTCLITSCLKRRIELLKNGNMSMIPIPDNVSSFTYFDATLHILHTAYGLSCQNITWDSERFVEFVEGITLKTRIVMCLYHIYPKPSTAEKSQRQFLQAQEFMQNLAGSNSPEFKLFFVMSKEFLRKALDCDDSQSNDITPSALVYLAALCFATSEYQTTIDICSTILIEPKTDKEYETLNAGCLLFNDDVARVVGFCLLFEKLNDKINCKGSHICLDLRLTSKLFAYYLMVISAEKIPKQLGLNVDLPTSNFPLDHFILVVIKQKSCTWTKSSFCLSGTKQCVYRRLNSLTASATLNVSHSKVKETLIDALTEYAFENLALFYNAIRNDLGIECNTIIDYYHALYLYKRRKYDEVLDLCERILYEPDQKSSLKEFAIANVLLMPPLESFFDRDVQSLLGFHTLVCYLFPLNDDMKNVEETPDSTFVHMFARYIYYDKNLLSGFLLLSVKYHYFLGRHFLARYLKLRCHVDCSNPFTEAMDELAAMKCTFPFEHIIRAFLLQKRRNPRNKYDYGLHL